MQGSYRKTKNVSTLRVEKGVYWHFYFFDMSPGSKVDFFPLRTGFHTSSLRYFLQRAPAHVPRPLPHSLSPAQDDPPPMAASRVSPPETSPAWLPVVVGTSLRNWRLEYLRRVWLDGRHKKGGIVSSQNCPLDSERTLPGPWRVSERSTLAWSMMWKDSSREDTFQKNQ